MLFCHPARSPMTQQVLDWAVDFVDVAALPDGLAGTPPQPIPVDFAARFARVIDIRDFAFDPAFCGVAMIDYFLAKLGLQPEAVPVALRRNSWLAPRVTRRVPAGLPDRYILFCPRTSMPQRDIPGDVQARLVAMMRSMRSLPVVTQGAADCGAIAAPECRDIGELCGLVANAAMIVSTDTAMVHLADAFARPCLSIFTTHAPEWRVRDYPLNQSVRMPVRGLPEALEFVRSEADLAAVAKAWVVGREMLEAAVRRFMA